MVNATKMCKSAGKKWSHFYALDGTAEYLRELSYTLHISAVSPIVDPNLGPPPGRHQAGCVVQRKV